jgi:hypothetical protein
LKTTATSVDGTDGYISTTEDMSSVTRILCDNPLSLKPTTKQNRELITYSTKIMNKVVENIKSILEEL